MLGPQVWTRRHVFEWRGTRYDQRESWYVARVADDQVDTSGFTTTERQVIERYHWWTAQELATTTEDLTPRALATLLQELIENGPPSEPLEVGV